MSSTSNHLPGLYLYVNYVGKKFYQHFSDFNDDSAQAFRDDLIEMKFHLPKTVNIWLFVRGCVVGFWPDVSESRQAILYNNLKGKIQAAAEDRSELDELSIRTITLKELDENGWTLLASTSNKGENDSPRPAKRRRYSRSPSPSHEEWTMPPRQKRSRDEAPPPPPVQPTSAMWVEPSANINPFHRMDTLRSNLSRLRARVPALLDEGKLLSNELKKLGATDVPPPMRLVDEMTDAAKEHEIELLQNRIKKMDAVARLQLSLKARLDEAANKLEVEEQLRMKSDETAALARQGEADARQRLEDVQDMLERESRRRNEADDLLATTRQTTRALQEAYGSEKQDKEDLARRYTRAQEKISALHRDADVRQLELERTARELGQVEQELHEEKERRKVLYGRLAVSERNEDALKQRCEDLTQQMASVARARTAEGQSARMARQRDEEALRLSAEKSRTQQLVIREAESAMQAARDSEEAMKRRLEEVERSLEVEKRLRREAEDAIEDIRRECREPFVVPSLLDAFVELAKLTTAATVPGILAAVKNKGDEMTSSCTPVPPGPANGGTNGSRENYVQEQSLYTPPASSLADARTESVGHQVKSEQLSPIWR